jgi:hypothetical protein
LATDNRAEVGEKGIDDVLACGPQKLRSSASRRKIKKLELSRNIVITKGRNIA